MNLQVLQRKIEYETTQLKSMELQTVESHDEAPDFSSVLMSSDTDTPSCASPKHQKEPTRKSGKQKATKVSLPDQQGMPDKQIREDSPLAYPPSVLMSSDTDTPSCASPKQQKEPTRKSGKQKATKVSLPDQQSMPDKQIREDSPLACPPSVLMSSDTDTPSCASPKQQKEPTRKSGKQKATKVSLPDQQSMPDKQIREDSPLACPPSVLMSSDTDTPSCASPKQQKESTRKSGKQKATKVSLPDQQSMPDKQIREDSPLAYPPSVLMSSDTDTPSCASPKQQKEPTRKSGKQKATKVSLPDQQSMPDKQIREDTPLACPPSVLMSSGTDTPSCASPKQQKEPTRKSGKQKATKVSLPDQQSMPDKQNREDSPLPCPPSAMSHVRSVRSGLSSPKLESIICGLKSKKMLGRSVAEPNTENTISAGGIGTSTPSSSGAKGSGVSKKRRRSKGADDGGNKKHKAEKADAPLQKKQKIIQKPGKPAPTMKSVTVRMYEIFEIIYNF